MKITPRFTHPQAMNTIGDILINILMHPSFIMAVNGTNEYEAKESASIHHKLVLHTAPGG